MNGGAPTHATRRQAFSHWLRHQKKLLARGEKMVADELNVSIKRARELLDAVSVDELKPIQNLKTDSNWSKEDPEGVERKEKVDFLPKWVRQDFEAGKYCIGINEKDLLNLSP